MQMRGAVRKYLKIRPLQLTLRWREDGESIDERAYDADATTSHVHPIPVSEYGHPGAFILPPTSVTHVHHAYPPGSLSYTSRSSEGETEPLQHPYGPPSQ
ncbi:hypothetical protein V8E53_004517 [Lactarius tabidus]